MQKYYKNLENGYITGIGTGIGDEEIAKEEYEHILSVIRSRPAPEAGYKHRLRADLTWEQVEAANAPEPEEPLSDIDEALAILSGEVTE